MEWPEDLGGSGGRGGGGTTGETPGDGGGGSGSGSGNGNNPTDPPLDSGKPWPKRVHDDIIDIAFRSTLNADQIEAIKRGSDEADGILYQSYVYSHVHAMRRVEETVPQASARMMEFFVEQSRKFVKNNDYEALGMALHPIMDAYAPPHMGFKMYPGFFNISILSHLPEVFTYLTPTITWDLDIIMMRVCERDFELVGNAAESISSIAGNLFDLSDPVKDEDLCIAYGTWLKGYLEYLKK